MAIFVGEFWCGWFDHWYKEHTNGRPQETAAMVEDFFKVGGSFNFYMFHGDTNFGFNNGANYDVEKVEYQPTVTSYDYGAPLSEAGDLTETYYAIKEVISKHTKVEDIKVALRLRTHQKIPLLNQAVLPKALLL